MRFMNNNEIDEQHVKHEAQWEYQQSITETVQFMYRPNFTEWSPFCLREQSCCLYNWENIHSVLFLLQKWKKKFPTTQTG